MNEMVERVASAIAAKTHAPTQGTVGWECYKDEYMEIARAAIEAMREPTDEMTRAGEDMCNLDRPAGDWVNALWDNMIGAALGEPR